MDIPRKTSSETSLARSRATSGGETWGADAVAVPMLSSRAATITGSARPLHPRDAACGRALRPLSSSHPASAPAFRAGIFIPDACCSHCPRRRPRRHKTLRRAGGRARPNPRAANRASGCDQAPRAGKSNSAAGKISGREFATKIRLVRRRGSCDSRAGEAQRHGVGAESARLGAHPAGAFAARAAARAGRGGKRPQRRRARRSLARRRARQDGRHRAHRRHRHRRGHPEWRAARARAGW